MKKKCILFYILNFYVLFVLGGNLNIIPYPNNIQINNGEFNFLQNRTYFIDERISSESLNKIDNFIYFLACKSSKDFQNKINGSAAINFIFDEFIHDEGYSLKIQNDNLQLRASTPSGFFYGIQTIKQLLPPSIWADHGNITSMNVRCCTINDYPRFKYRGAHLDVSRHFFPVETIKEYIDILAMHKMNYFHWHLTDDQGWRIEIKKYPKLTQIGSIREGTVIGKDGILDSIPYSGYYTQDEIREIVSYAKDNCITIIPEIDMPGHMLAALASYPELGCVGHGYKVWGKWGVSNDVLCAGKEQSYSFVKDVLDEIVDLFPSHYIHLGGDECPKFQWEKCPNCQKKIRELNIKGDDKFNAEYYLQTYFLSEISSFLKKKNRYIIGWDEILEGGEIDNSTVMSWRGIKGGIIAAKKKHNVIMTPESYLYFNYYQSKDIKNEPLSYGGFLPVEKVYNYEPVPQELDIEEKKYIIGAQSNLWTEYIKNPYELFYHLLPRLDAISEVQWTFVENKNWPRFLTSLKKMFRIYDNMELSYAKHVFDVSYDYRLDKENHTIDFKFFTVDDSPIYYSINNKTPYLESNSVVRDSLRIKESCNLKFFVPRNNIRTEVYSIPIMFHKGVSQKAILQTNPNELYSFKKEMVLTDGMRGDNSFGSGKWLGFYEEPLDILYTFNKGINVSKIIMGCLVDVNNWIFPPQRIEVFVSDDGYNFTSVLKEDYLINKDFCKNGIRNIELKIPSVDAVYLKVVAEPLKYIPNWHPGKGTKAFLFVDEIVIN